MYSFFVDDQASGYTSRVEGRIHLDKQLEAPFVVDEPSESPGTMTRQELAREKEAELRASWGHDPAAQAQWNR